MNEPMSLPLATRAGPRGTTPAHAGDTQRFAAFAGRPARIARMRP